MLSAAVRPTARVPGAWRRCAISRWSRVSAMNDPGNAQIRMARAGADIDAQAMADLLHGDHAHVNLIPMNPVAHTPWQASPMGVIDAFAATLLAAGIETTIRHNRGQEIGAACGQLAAERAGEPSAPAVARRRARLETASAAALRGERSDEPVPAGVGE